MKNKPKFHWKLVIGALICCLLWASAPACIKWSYKQMNISGTPSILLYAGTRFFVAGWLVVLMYFLIRRRFLYLPYEAGSSVLLLSLFQTVGQYLFYYVGLAYTTAIIGAIILGTSAFFALILSACIFRLEKATVDKILGCFLGFLGILVMNLEGLHFSSSLVGEGFLIISQICCAFSSVLLQLFSKKYSPVMLSGWQFIMGGLMLVFTGLMSGGEVNWTWAGVRVLIWLAAASAAAYTLWGILLSKYTVSSVSVYACMIPVFGVLFSYLVLHETDGFVWQTLLALILVGLGVFLTNKEDPENKTAEEDDLFLY